MQNKIRCADSGPFESFYTPDRSHFLLLLSSRTRREVLSHTLLAPRVAKLTVLPPTVPNTLRLIRGKRTDPIRPCLPTHGHTHTHTHAMIIARVARSQTRRASLVIPAGSLSPGQNRSADPHRVRWGADVSERGRKQNRFLGVGRALGELRAERSILGHELKNFGLCLVALLSHHVRRSLYQCGEREA